MALPGDTTIEPWATALASSCDRAAIEVASVSTSAHSSGTTAGVADPPAASDCRRLFRQEAGEHYARFDGEQSRRVAVESNGGRHALSSGYFALA
jgi:hypothetical protein